MNNETSVRKLSGEFSRTDLTNADKDRTTDASDALPGQEAPAQLSIKTPSRTTVALSLPGMSPEILHDIFNRLPVIDIARVSMTCPQLHTHALGYLRRPPLTSERRAQYVNVCATRVDKAQKTLASGRLSAYGLLPPTQAYAKALMELRQEQLTSEAELVAAACGDTYHDVAFTMDDDYTEEIGAALIQAGGWRRLELRVKNAEPLGPFLWQLMEAQAHKDSPERKISITYDQEFRTALTPDARMLLTCLPDVGSKLQLTGVAWYRPLADNPNSNALALHLLSFADDDQLAMVVREVRNLKVEDFHLSLQTAIGVNSTCLAGLVTPQMRRLKCEGMHFNTGSLAGFGPALGKSKAIEKLAFTNCTFNDQEEWKALLDGVAASRSLTHFSLVGCEAGQALMDDKLAQALAQCTSLQAIEITPFHIDPLAEGLRQALLVSRPDVTVTEDLDWGRENAGVLVGVGGQHHGVPVLAVADDGQDADD
ncbi:MAG: hypothetical protein JWP36_2279 [Paucimonas sp.]|nr:hypothetical protein [Paucimonas sp.]